MGLEFKEARPTLGLEGLRELGLVVGTGLQENCTHGQPGPIGFDVESAVGVGAGKDKKTGDKLC